MNGRFALVWVVFVGAAGFGQATAATAQSVDQSRPSRTPVVDTAWLRDRDPQPTPADELLQALRRRRPINDLIRPVGFSADAGSGARGSLLPEGASLVDRPGLLVADAGRWSFAFDPTETPSTIRLLPGANLDTMVRTARGSSAVIHFVVSGEVTVFEGENYLIVRSVSRSVPSSNAFSAPAAKTADASATPPDRPSDRTATSPKPAGESASPGSVEGTAPVEDVLSRLRNREPETPMPLAPPPLPNRRERRSMTSASLVADGTPVVRRPGRLIRDGDWWTFAFESDHPERPEPPVKLLPSRGVERMVRAFRRDSSGLVFLVSGEMTLFEDENYLLPRTVIRRIDMGNLTK